MLKVVEVERERCATAGHTIRPIEVHTQVSGGNWVEVALQMIDEHQLDLVITGTHGPKGLLGKIMGSDSEHLVSKAPCSVFVVKPRGFPYLRD